MSANTNIEWADHTFNPWEGCQKVGPGCDFCYAEARNARFGGGVAPNWGPGAPRRRTSKGNWRNPLSWDRDAAVFYELHGRRQRVFCASLADVFDNAVDPQWRIDLFDLIDATPDLIWMLLTKRIGNVQPMMSEMGRAMPENVRLGITVVNQEEANRDVIKLLATKSTLAIEFVFLSVEPMLGPIDLTNLKLEHRTLNAFTGVEVDDLGECGWMVGIDEVIVGGESGPGARPMHPDWARSLRDQCASAGVPFHFKQWGEWLPCVIDHDGERFVAYPEDGHENPIFESEASRPVKTEHGQEFWRVGKKNAGRLLDGQLHDGSLTQ